MVRLYLYPKECHSNDSIVCAGNFVSRHVAILFWQKFNKMWDSYHVEELEGHVEPIIPEVVEIPSLL